MSLSYYNNIIGGRAGLCRAGRARAGLDRAGQGRAGQYSGVAVPVNCMYFISFPSDLQ